MKTDAEMPWPATADEHDDLKNLILEIKHKNDRIIQLLIAVSWYRNPYNFNCRSINSRTPSVDDCRN